MTRGERLNELDAAKTRKGTAVKKLASLQTQANQIQRDIEDCQFDVEATDTLHNELLRRCNRDGLADSEGKEIPEERIASKEALTEGPRSLGVQSLERGIDRYRTERLSPIHDRTGEKIE